MSDVPHLLQRADILWELGRFGEAEQVARDALALDPNSAHAFTALARALYSQERHQEAAGAAERAVVLAPERAAGHYMRGSIACALNDLPTARVCAEQTIHLAPHSGAGHLLLARALLLERRPRVRDAYDCAVRAVALEPEDASAHNTVGICLDGLGDRAGAAGAFRNALAIDPLHSLAQNNLAALDLDSGRLGRAAGQLRNAVAHAPQEKLLHTNLDTLLVKLGHRVLLSLAVTCILLGVLLATGAPWWARAGVGLAHTVVTVLLARPVLASLPRGIGQWGRGILRRVDWPQRILLLVLGLVTPLAVVMAFGPTAAAIVAGFVLVALLQIGGPVSVVALVIAAGVALARGR